MQKCLVKAEGFVKTSLLRTKHTALPSPLGMKEVAFALVEPLHKVHAVAALEG